MIFRGVAFEFRGKVDHPQWRKIWDTCIFAGSVVPAFLFGVAFANIFMGLPIDGEGLYHGTLVSLLHPYGLLGGALFMMLFLAHGAIWLAIKSEDALHEKALAAAGRLWPMEVGAAAIFLMASMVSTRLYDNYLEHPAFFLVLFVMLLSLLSVKWFLARKAYFKAWFGSAVTIIGATFFGVIGLYPKMIPSSIDDRDSLTAHNASSSPLTLKIMLMVVLIFIPIVITYQIWAYKLFSGKINAGQLDHDASY